MGKGHRRCEVCGIKEGRLRHTGNKLHFSKFPLDYTCPTATEQTENIQGLQSDLLPEAMPSTSQQSRHILMELSQNGSKKMAPLLYELDGSPPACAVRMVADIIGLQLDFKVPDISKLEHKSPDYLQLNPLGTIPVLMDDDFVLSDSHAIMIYLLSAYGSDKSEWLYPSDVRTRATVNQVLFFDTGILFIRIKVVALPTVMEGMKSPSDKHLYDLEEAYGMIEAYLSRHKYIAAEHLTIADLSVACTLGAADTILPLNKVKFPLTATWQALMQELPFFKKIATPGIAKFNLAMQYYWKKNNE